MHLHTHSAFSFGSGPSLVSAMVLRAAELGLPSIALTDTNSITGIPELVRRCQKAGIQPIGGCEVVLEGGARLTLLADGPTGFSSLCQILSAAGLRDVERDGLRVRLEDLERHSEGLVCLTGAPPQGWIPKLLLQSRDEESERALARLLGIFGRDRVFVEVVRSLAEGEHSLSLHLFDLADRLGIRAVATNAVAYSTKTEFPACEALLRVGLVVPVGEEHGELPLNGERYLKPIDELERLFADRPDALRNARELAGCLVPPLDPTIRHFPRYPQLPSGESAFSLLSGLVWEGARRRGITDAARLIHELETIRDLGYCDYFLICHDVIHEARRRSIGCALRGSAIGSAALYALGVSDHDPITRRVSFERFLSRARRKPPDIDIDFRHDRRDEMYAYLRQTYGSENVANVSNYVTYRGRSLLRDFGKILGFDGPELDRLRELLWHARGDDLAERLQTLPELRALQIDPDTYGDLFALCAQLAGNPRHLGTHSSGIVVSDVPVCEVAPMLWAAKGVPVVAFDKDDVESPGIGLLKMDQLCLRALTAVDIATTKLKAQDELFDYTSRDREDPETLAMIRAAETIGVFQLESPAQMALQWRLKADKFDDLVHAVALVRPGPLVGGGIAPYVAVRHGNVKPHYPLPELEPVLAETYGRILFQDQVLDVVRVVGGFSADEADVWQKAITHARSEEEMKSLGRELLERVKPRGMTGKAFEKLWKQIKGFSRYGFCHGHSVAFADHAQGTAWLMHHHPAEFLAALLSVEPMGFWPVATVVEEARRRGITPLGPCLNRSHATQWQVETPNSIRCPLSFVKNVKPELAEAIAAEWDTNGDFDDLPSACRRLGFVPRDALEWLVLSGALDALCPSRRRAIWSLPALHRAPDTKRKLILGQQGIELAICPMLPPDLPDFLAAEKEQQEWQALGFSPQGHPMRHLREKLTRRGIQPSIALQACEDGEEITLAGLSLMPHRPPVASGEIVVFLTLEDETGLAQVTVPPAVYERWGSRLLTERVLAIHGRAVRRGIGNILTADCLQDLP
ncbi:DNA polymerase III subunit alpha [Armatimonas rosea]